MLKRKREGNVQALTMLGDRGRERERYPSFNNSSERKNVRHEANKEIG